MFCITKDSPRSFLSIGTPVNSCLFLYRSLTIWLKDELRPRWAPEPVPLETGDQLNVETELSGAEPHPFFPAVSGKELLGSQEKKDRLARQNFGVLLRKLQWIYIWGRGVRGGREGGERKEGAPAGLSGRPVP